MSFKRFNARHFSILIPFLLYLVLLGLALKFSFPLRSESKPKDFMSFLDRVKKKKGDMKKESVITSDDIAKRLPPVQVLSVVFKQ